MFRPRRGLVRGAKPGHLGLAVTRSVEMSRPFRLTSFEVCSEAVTNEVECGRQGIDDSDCRSHVRAVNRPLVGLLFRSTELDPVPSKIRKLTRSASALRHFVHWRV